MMAGSEIDRSGTSGRPIDVSGGNVEYDRPTRGIYVGSGGDLVVVMKDDVDQPGDPALTEVQNTFKNLAAGYIHAISAHKIIQTGTTASDLIAIF